MPRVARWRLVLLCLLAAAPGHRAAACSCAPSKGAAAALSRADAVFSGRVIGMREERWSDEARFEVIATWKGVTEDSVSVWTERSTCGFPFKEGQSYLVYAEERDGQLSTHLCSRSRSLDADTASADIAELGDPLPRARTPESSRSLLADLQAEVLGRRLKACEALGHREDLREESVPLLGRMLDASRDRSERSCAAKALGSLGAHVPSVALVLAAHVGDDDTAFGIDVARALGMMREAAAPAVPQLLAMLEDETEKSSLLARREHLPPERRDELRGIEEGLKSLEVRRGAILHALGAMASHASREAGDVLLCQFGAGRRDRALSTAIREVGAGREAAQILIGELREGPTLAAVSGLQALGPDASAAVPLLVELLSVRGWRTASANTLGAIGPAAAAAVPHLARELDAPDADQLALVKALASIGSRASAPALARMLRESRDDRVVEAALVGLVGMGLDPNAVEPARSRSRAPAPARESMAAGKDDSAALPLLATLGPFGSGPCRGAAAHATGVLAASPCHLSEIRLVDVVTGAILATHASPDGPDVGERRSWFGEEIAVSGATILVAAPWRDGAAIGCGAVYAFAPGSTPIRIDNPRPAYDTRFGESLAAGRDFFVATMRPRMDAPSGGIAIVELAGRLRHLVEVFPSGATVRGAELAVVGDRIACAPFPALMDGRPAEVFVFDAGSGMLLRTIRGPRPDDDDDFGCRLAPFGERRLLVGARNEVHVVDVESGEIIASVVAGGDRRRGIVAIDDERFAVGDAWTRVRVHDASGMLLAVAESPLGDLSRGWGFGERLIVVNNRLLVRGTWIDPERLTARASSGPEASPSLRSDNHDMFLAYGLDPARRR